MDNRKLEVLAKLMDFLKDSDADVLRAGMMPAHDEMNESPKDEMAEEMMEHMDQPMRHPMGQPKGIEVTKVGLEVMPGKSEKGPMELLAEKGSDPKSLRDDEEIDDEELMELEGLNA